MYNEALHEICHDLDFRRPTFTNLNRLHAQTISSLVASLRCDGHQNVGIIEFSTHLTQVGQAPWYLSSLDLAVVLVWSCAQEVFPSITTKVGSLVVVFSMGQRFSFL